MEGQDPPAGAPEVSRRDLLKTAAPIVAFIALEAIGGTAVANGASPPKHNANGHTWEHGDCELVAVIRTGQGPLTESMRRSTPPPGALTMPAFRDRLSDAEIADTIAYIKTMWTPEERASQAGRTRERCGAAG